MGVRSERGDGNADGRRETTAGRRVREQLNARRNGFPAPAKRSELQRHRGAAPYPVADARVMGMYSIRESAVQGHN